jgi:hypothetical protein
MTNTSWASFRFESSQACGLVASPDDWAKIKKLYHQAYGSKNIYWLRENVNRHQPPEFGQQLDHKADRTLGDFFKENGMELI